MIKKIVIYSIVFISLIYFADWFVLEGLRKNKHGIYEKYNTLFFKQNPYNTLIIGSSRAEMHLNTELLDSLTHLNSYNAGVSGASTRMAYVILKSYLVNSQLPKVIFLECDFHIAHLKTDTIYNFPRYFPYLSNSELYNQFHNIDRRFFQFKNNPLYALPFEGIPLLNASLNGWIGKTGVYDLNYKKGFFENKIADNYGHFSVKKYHGFIHQETRQYLDSIILFSKKYNCQLILTMSPVYKSSEKEVINKDKLIEQYKNIAYVNHLSLLDYSSDPDIVNNQSLFEDNYHMYETGARIYTKKIAEEFIRLKENTFK